MDFKMERCRQELPINVREEKMGKQRGGEKTRSGSKLWTGTSQDMLETGAKKKKKTSINSVWQKENQDSEKKENSNMVCFYPLQPVNNFSSSHMLTSGENNLYDGYTGL